MFSMIPESSQGKFITFELGGKMPLFHMETGADIKLGIFYAYAY